MMQIEIEREEDGRFIGEVPELPGVLAYGPSPEKTRRNIEALRITSQ